MTPMMPTSMVTPAIAHKPTSKVTLPLFLVYSVRRRVVSLRARYIAIFWLHLRCSIWLNARLVVLPILRRRVPLYLWLLVMGLVGWIPIRVGPCFRFAFKTTHFVF
ncbi:hypothetical protein B0J14DRAFT_599723 [Halenospora varia]|nr:hypothetical protein B0J14DRAFT_599723 [Halenospora varia]